MTATTAIREIAKQILNWTDAIENEGACRETCETNKHPMTEQEIEARTGFRNATK